MKRMADFIEEYLKEVYQKISVGDASEGSFYGPLEKLFFSFGQNLKKKTIVTTLPKKSEFGNPDFRIWDGESKICGYIEAKAPSVEALDSIETTEQLQRYKKGYPNLILTNFLEFRLFREGTAISKPVKISDFELSKRIPDYPIIQHKQEFVQLLTSFFNFSRPRILSAKTLAEVLAIKAKDMRDLVVLPTLRESENNYFYWLYLSFKNNLMKDLSFEDFADYFSQTFTYGLLIAKYQYEFQETLFGKKQSNLPFTTKTAYDYVQKNFGILREVFKVISTEEMPQNLEIIVDEIVDILNNTEIYKIVTRVGDGKKDPVFHLYETFLSKFDSDKKIKLGVFYTPLPVVSYIVNSTHEILKDKELFDCPDGLASYKGNELENSVTLLDPAVGTGTFFIGAIEKAIEEVQSKYSEEKSYLSSFIREHILKHFFAFEISIAPYVVSHFKVLFSLTDKGFTFDSGDRLNIFLTNTLEFNPKDSMGSHSTGMFERVLVTEQEYALEVKNSTPVMVVIGNPPYSVSSQNEIDKTTEFGRFYESYKENVRKEERNIQPLSDDYIKFIAFAHWKIQQSGKGIVAMITNNSFLDGLIHRDMRRKLLEDFDRIYILNLHGDTQNPKVNDKNVFEIREGVSISFFIKSEKSTKKQIFYSEIIDTQENKYKFLEENNISSTEWKNILYKKPFFFFTNKDFSNEEIYNKFVPLQEIVLKNTVGIVTGNDSVLVCFNKETLNAKFSKMDDDVFHFTHKYNAPEQIIDDWYKEAMDGCSVSFYSYRPFDRRFTIYNSKVLQRARRNIMDNFLNENLAVAITNSTKSENYTEVFVTNIISDKHLCGQQTYIFPLWIYRNNKNETQQQDLLNDNLKTEKKSNVNQEIIDLLRSNFRNEIVPENIFYYIYAVLYSNTYRQKYQEFLKIDFPRIPFTKKYDLFRKMSELGEVLVELHLLKSSLLDTPSAKFYGEDGSLVKKIRFENNKIWLNDKQYFAEVPEKVWNYQIGGYQVLSKWLKDRKGKILSSDEIKTYCKIVTALTETIKIQKEIDVLYLEVELSLINTT